MWHRRRGLDEPWRTDRFNRLCKLLNCPVEELGALVGVFDGRLLRRWIDANSIPPYVAINLQMIEDAYMQARHGATFEPVMPVHLLS